MTTLPKGAHIEGVIPQYCSGPGWSNQVVLVLWNRGGERGGFYLQADEWTKHQGLAALFRVGATVAEELTAHAKALLAADTEER
jgi:hypothetical protein